MSIWLIEWYKKRFRFVNLIDLRLLYPFPPFPFLLTWNDTMGYCRYHVVFLLRKIIYDINAICTIRISMLSTVETNAGYYKFTCINTVTIFSVLFFWKSGSIVFFPKYLNFIEKSIHRFYLNRRWQSTRRGRRGRDRMVVGAITINAISDYHN